MTCVRQIILLAFSLAGSALVIGAAMAQTLSDPTRPPTYRAPDELAKQVAAQGGTAGLTAIWSVGAQRYAMFDGKQIQVGMRLGEQRVIRITDNEVTLVGPEGRNTLALVDGIEKKTRHVEPDAPRRRARTPEK